MSRSNRFLALFLTFLLTCGNHSGILYGGAEYLVHEDPTGQLTLTKPFSETMIETELEDIAVIDPAINFMTESPLSPAQNEERIDELAEWNAVLDERITEHVTYDFPLSNDPFYGSSGSWGNSYDDLWWLKRVHADVAWEVSRGTGVTVAVIDTGLDYSHPDIAGNIWFNEAELFGLPGVDDDGNGYVDDTRGWDFHNHDNNPLDDNGHGTHVAGIIGAVADNALGIAGVAPESKILPIKVLDSGGLGFVQNVISAIRYAVDLGAQVINMSLGIIKNYLSKSLQRDFEDAVKYAVDKGTVVVAAAGNSSMDVRNAYPAAISDVISVGAVEPLNDTRAWFSNFGKTLDLVAPGVDILSLRAGGTSFGSSSLVDPLYSRASGTSMASPIVAGVAALLRAWDPFLTVADVINRLQLSAEDLGSVGIDSNFGYSLVDAYQALTITIDDHGSNESAAGGAGKKGNAPGREKGNSNNYNFPGADGGLILGNNGVFLFNGLIGTWYRIDVFREAISQKDENKRKKLNFSVSDPLHWSSEAVVQLSNKNQVDPSVLVSLSNFSGAQLGHILTPAKQVTTAAGAPF